MNEILRRAILSAGLDEVDVAARLEVDPKTIRRWLEGRLPYPRHRWLLAVLLHVNESDLWPELRAIPSRPDEIVAIYPSRSSIPRETWQSMLESVEHEIRLLSYSGLFLAEDNGIMRIIAERARTGTHIQIALSDPRTRLVKGFAQDDAGTARVIKIRQAIDLYRPLCDLGNVEIRLHQEVLYNSLYLFDDEVLCIQHVYGICAARTSVMRLRCKSDYGMARAYIDSFSRIWRRAARISDTDYFSSDGR